MGLSPEMIALLQSKRRVKGLYEEKLIELYSDSDEAGVDVAETWVEFVGKTATTLYQGFSNAAKKLELEDAVDIVNRDGHVYILVKTRVALVMADMTGGNEVEDASNGHVENSDAENIVAELV